MYFFPDGHTIDFSTSITTCCIVASLQQFVVVSLCCVSLRHDDMKFIAASFFSLKPLMRSSKEKKAKEKRSHYSVIDWAKRIKRQLMENIIKCSYPKMTGQNDRPDESLTGQVHDQAGHCPLTGRYFEHWIMGFTLSTPTWLRLRKSHAMSLWHENRRKRGKLGIDINILYHDTVTNTRGYRQSFWSELALYVFRICLSKSIGVSIRLETC